MSEKPASTHHAPVKVDASAPDYVHHSAGEHSHKHSHGELGAHQHRHEHAGGQKPHTHGAEHAVHDKHPQHNAEHHKVAVKK